MRNIWVTKKSIILGVIMVCTVITGLTACAGNESDNKQMTQETTANIVGETQKVYSDISVNQDARQGNSNANIANGGMLMKQKDWIYYGLKDGLYKCKEDGTQKEKLFSIDNGGGIFNINVIDEWIYFGGWGIFRIKTDGTGYEQIAPENIRGGTHFIGNEVYKGNEYRMKIDGSDIEQIYDKNSAYGHTLNIVDGWIYFYDTDSEKNDGIYKMKLDGSDLEKIFDGRSDNMIVDDEWVYFANKKDHDYLYKMKTDGTDVQLLEDSSVNYLNVTDNWIYYSGENGLSKMKTDGSDSQVLTDSVASSLHTAGEWIYYYLWNGTEDSLYRIRTDGTENQLFAVCGEVEIKEEDTDEVSDTEKDLITYKTKFGEVEMVECPTFYFDYPSDWHITKEEVDGGDPQKVFGEVVTVSNDRGVEVTYMDFNMNSIGGGGRTMSRYDVSKAADADFLPTIPDGTDSDFSHLGKFMVAKIKLTGTLDMDADTDYTSTDTDGGVSYALLPESYIGIHDNVQGLSGFYEEFSFKYPAPYAFIAESPDGLFTDEEEREIIAILASFRDLP